MKESRIREAVEGSASIDEFFPARGRAERTNAPGNDHPKEFRLITTLDKCINCGATAMHRSRLGVDCGEETCIEEIPVVVEKLQQDLQATARGYAKDTKYWEDKIGMLEESLDFWRDLAKKRHESFRRLKIKLKHAKGVY